MVAGSHKDQRPITFGIIGAGWRAEFFFRIARELPQRFRISGVVSRDENRRNRVHQNWGLKTYETIDSLLDAADFDFIVVSVPRIAAPAILQKLSRHQVPALTETPPAADLNGLTELYEQSNGGKWIQVAEQYAFQPLHAARLNIACSGLLGTISQAQISIAHGYHGVSLMRKFLGIQFEEGTVSARKFESPIIEGPGRGGPPGAEKTIFSRQIIAQIDFDGKLGIFDFTGDQYFSWIRSARLLVRGEKGEINNREVRFLKNFATPVEVELHRVNAGEDGNLEGYYLKGIFAGQDSVYQNPFIPARLTDDEIAVATCLDKMAVFAQGGPSFYSLSEASQDHYLGLLMDSAVQSEEKVTAKKQVWASE
jgi:hypothetical protein